MLRPHSGSRVLAPETSVEVASTGLGMVATPLLEKERDLSPEAIISDRAHPVGFNRPSARA